MAQGRSFVSETAGAWLLVSEGVANSSASTREAAGAEEVIVGGIVEASLGANKKAALNIELDAATEVDQEMLVAGVVGGVAVAASVAIEAIADGAEAAVEVKINVIRNLWRIDGVEVEEDGAKIQTLIEISVILSLSGSPVNLASDAEVVPENHIAAKAGIGAAAKRSRGVTATGRISGGRNQSADAEPQVDFLRLREIRERCQRGAGKRQEDGNT
jgi:hypothetical protein